jgi:hypothetical protein
MRVFKTRDFAKFARKAKITDDALCEAIVRAGRGLINADLGGGLIKQRVARDGRGRSGGFRTIIALRLRDRAVFIHGFAKSDKGNISADDLSELKREATVLLGLSRRALADAVDKKEFQEVFCDAKEISE